MAAAGTQNVKPDSMPRMRRLSFTMSVDWHVIVPLVAATLVFALGGFFAWQGWLMASVEHGMVAGEAARTQAVEAIAGHIRQTEKQVEDALDTPAVQQALAQEGQPGRDAARIALKAALPGATDVEFFSPNLNEVLSGDLRRIGYAKAAALMQAKLHPEHPPAEMHTEKDSSPQLMLALPARVGGQVAAFAVAEFPFTSIIELFHGIALSNARLDLRQGDGRIDQYLATIGVANSSTAADLGVPIPGSNFRVGKGIPEYPIIISGTYVTSAISAALCMLGAIIALWLRRVGLERAMSLFPGARKGKDATFAEIMGQMNMEQTTPPPPAPAATTPKKALPPAAKAPSGAVQVDPSIFRAYDIRGVVGKTLTADVARLIGRAVGSEARDRGQHEIVIGRDGRLSGPELVAALSEGLRAAGMNVIDIGAVPTPVTYFASYHLHTGSCISVTGSHNPPDYNGFKIVLGGETLSEDAIRALHQRIVDSRFTEGAGDARTVDIDADYIRRITDDVQVERRLKIVVDGGNGVTGVIAPAVLEGIGCEVVTMFCEIDGTFPNHHPDPSDLHNLQDLIAMTKQTGADLGLAFDGDGDRLGVVTASGEVIFPDRLLMLFAMDILTRNPGATIIYDVKCTGRLQSLILEHGGSPLMWRTGHSLIKAKMRETEAVLAGEMSGHFFFGERWYGFDDGIYAAARLLEILAGDAAKRTPQAIFDTLPKGLSTPELKIQMREGEHYRFIETFREKARFDGARLTTIDGVRADWPDGWGLVRASNTTPVLVLRFEADDSQALDRIQDVFREQFNAIDPKLKLPF